VKNSFGRIIVCILVFFSTGAITGIYSGQEALTQGTTAAASNVGLEIFFGCIYAVLLAFLFTERHRALTLLWREKWMTLFILFAMLSTAWSISPEETFRRSLGLLGTTLAGLYIAMHFEPKQQVRIISACIVLAGVLSIVLYVMWPKIALTPDGYLQGVFFQKNTLGRIMCLGILCLVFVAVGHRKNRMAALFAIPLCIGLLAVTGSVTAMLVTGGLILLVPFVPVIRWPAGRLVAFCAAAAAVLIPVAILIVANAETVLRTLGKESTLTGRLPLWRLVRDEIATMPFVGHGYAVFWASATADRFRQALRWDVMNSHNLFLEMLLGLGFLGLIIFLIGLLRNFILAFRIARAGEGIDSVWPLFFLIFCLLWDITDSTLFINNSIFWLFYTATAFYVVEQNAYLKAEAREEYEVPEALGEPLPS